MNSIKKMGKIGNTKQSSKSHQEGQKKHFCFTFNNYTKSDINTLLTVFSSICIKYCFQEETGINGVKHLQGVISLTKPMRWTEFNLSNKIHWEATKNVKQSYTYCCKDDTRTGNIYKYGFPEEIQVISNLFKWQTTVLNKCMDKPDDRTVNWIYDKNGCAGKTAFVKYMFVKHKAVVFTGGKANDIAYQLCLLNKDKTLASDFKIAIFDIARSNEGMISYKAIERIKDGIMTSPKYESCTVVFNNVHVWIFSNDLPDISKLSEDRWKIWTIEDKEDLIPYTIDSNRLNFGGEYDNDVL